jgi:hypothetical protein
MIDVPDQVTEVQLEQWVADFDAWTSVIRSA